MIFPTRGPRRFSDVEVRDYIKKIYESPPIDKGTFIGNLFIKIGKFLGGHHSV
jgi:hypothetical protein